MPQYQLYHAASGRALLAGYDAHQAATHWRASVAAQHDPRHAPYRLVATITAPALHAVYGLTNHGVQADTWTDNPGVQLHTDQPVRSTSVGDVVVAPDGTAWLCVSIGWQPLKPVDPTAGDADSASP